DGSFDTSDAYATGVGRWDKVAINYGYRELAPDKEKQELATILDNARADGLLYISHGDTRPDGSAHPQAHLRDNGTNAVHELGRSLKVRARSLERFSLENVPVGAPLAALEDQFVLLYFLHRYQITAAAKVVGGLEYSYRLRGDGQKPHAVVAPKEQRRALD